MRRHAGWLLAFGFFASASDAQVVNPEFDSGTSGWTFHLDAGSGGVLDWDAATGDPAPGSVSAANAFPGAHVDGWRQCVAVSGADYAISARVASALQTGNACRITIDFIANQACVNGTPIVLEVKLANTRNDDAFETLASGGPLSDGIQAAALSLDHVRNAAAAAGDSSCHFDDVTLGPDTILHATFE